MKLKLPDRREFWRNRDLYIMLVPVVIYLSIFVFLPIIQGVIISMQNFTFVNDSEFIGFKNYLRFTKDKNFWRAFGNTIIFAGWNAFLGVVLSCSLAIALSEFRNKFFRGITQTMLYIPSLFSWVVIGSAFMMLLSPTTGPVNLLIKSLGSEPIYFWGKAELSKTLIIFVNQWKITGYGIIIYLAAIVGIPAEQYEAAEMDGANRWHKIRFVTLPNLGNTIRVMIMLNIMSMFLLFDPIYVLQNEITRSANDVLMTYTYRTSVVKLNLGYGAAISVVVCIVSLAITMITKKATRFGLEND